MDEASLAANPGEYLDPGYDPQTPDDDNLLLSFMRAERELWRSWGECVDAEIGGDDDAGVFWVDSGSASVFGNPVLWTRPVDAAAAPALVQRQTTAFARRSGGPYLLYSAFPTPDLAQHGLQAVGHPPCMVRLPAETSERPSAGALNMRRVGSDRELDDFERTFLEAYPVPDLMPWQPRGFMGERLLDDRRWHLFVGYVDGAPVATSAACVTDSVVDVSARCSRTRLWACHDGGGCWC